MSELTTIVTAYRPFLRGTLCGFVTAYIPEMHLIIYDIAVHRHASGAHWAQVPAKPLLDADGTARRSRDGRVEYVPLLSFDSREVRESFSKAVVAALLRFEPGAFGDEPPA